jgi:hypothetical protein
MRQWIRSHLTYANVMATLAVFIALGGGTTAVALSGSNTVQSDDLGPAPQVKAPDVAANAVNGTNIVDGSLHAVDVGQASFAGLSVMIHALPAHQCRTDPLNGISAKGDHLLLTPSVSDGYLQEIHAIRYDPSSGDSGDTYVQTCNVSDTSLPGHLTHFNLLIFNAQ